MAKARKSQETPEFEAALRSLGSNDHERGNALGLSHRGVQDLRAGMLNRTLVALMRQPFILRALADDAEDLLAEAGQQEETDTSEAQPDTPYHYLPLRSLEAIVKALQTSALLDQWQTERAGDTIIAQKDGSAMVTSLTWTEQGQCTGFEMRITTSNDILFISPLTFAELLPEEPGIYWNGKRGCWEGHTRERLPTQQNLPTRGVLIANLTCEVAQYMLLLGHNLQLDDPQNQQYSHKAAAYAGICCGTDAEETPLS